MRFDFLRAAVCPAPRTSVSVDAYLPGPARYWRHRRRRAGGEIFGNAQLNGLEITGLAANPTIGEAQQNLLAAQANAGAANGAFLPQVALNPPAYPLVSRQSYPAGPNGYPPYTLYTLTGQISYDPGLFGARQIYVLRMARRWRIIRRRSWMRRGRVWPATLPRRRLPRLDLRSKLQATAADYCRGTAPAGFVAGANMPMARFRN